MQSNNDEKHDTPVVDSEETNYSLVSRSTDKRDNDTSPCVNGTSVSSSSSPEHEIPDNCLSVTRETPTVTAPESSCNPPPPPPPPAIVSLDSSTCAIDHQYTGHHEHYHHHDSALGRRRSSIYNLQHMKQHDIQKETLNDTVTSVTATVIDTDDTLDETRIHDSSSSFVVGAATVGCSSLTPDSKSIASTIEHHREHIPPATAGSADAASVISHNNVTGATSGDNLHRKNVVTFRSGGHVYHHVRSNSTNSSRATVKPCTTVKANVHQDTIKRSFTIATSVQNESHSRPAAVTHSTLTVHSCLRKSISSSSQFTPSTTAISTVNEKTAFGTSRSTSSPPPSTHRVSSDIARVPNDIQWNDELITSAHDQLIEECKSSENCVTQLQTNQCSQCTLDDSCECDGGECFHRHRHHHHHIDNDETSVHDKTLNPLRNDQIESVNESDNQIDVHCVDDKVDREESRQHSSGHRVYHRHQHHHHERQLSSARRVHSSDESYRSHLNHHQHHHHHQHDHHHHHHHHHVQSQRHHQQHDSFHHQRCNEQQLHSPVPIASTTGAAINVINNDTNDTNKVATDASYINLNHHQQQCRRVSVNRSVSNTLNNYHPQRGRRSPLTGEMKDVLAYTKFFMLTAFVIFICGSGITVHELIDFLNDSSSAHSNRYISGCILLSIGLLSLFGLYGALKEDSLILLIYGLLIVIMFIGHVILLFMLKKICLDKRKKCYSNVATPPGIAPIIVAMSELAIALSSIFMSIVIESHARRTCTHRVHLMRDYKKRKTHPASSDLTVVSSSCPSSSDSRRGTFMYDYTIVSQEDDTHATRDDDGHLLIGSRDSAVDSEKRRKQLPSTSSSSSGDGAKG